MISHTIAVISKAVEYLNPGQIVLLLATSHNSVGSEGQCKEDNLVVKLGGLHTKKAALKAIGTWLAGSGWVEVLSQAEITRAGRAESLINCAQIRSTRYAHQVTAAC